MRCCLIIWVSLQTKAALKRPHSRRFALAMAAEFSGCRGVGGVLRLVPPGAGHSRRPFKERTQVEDGGRACFIGRTGFGSSIGLGACGR